MEKAPLKINLEYDHQVHRHNFEAIILSSEITNIFHLTTSNYAQQMTKNKMCFYFTFKVENF